MAGESGYQTGVYRAQGGASYEVTSAGTLSIHTSGTLTMAGTDVSATAAELNIMDGVTATSSELNALDGITATVAELNIMDGVTATSAELSIMDGVTATSSELNIMDGVTATSTNLNALAGVGVVANDLNALQNVWYNVYTPAITTGASGEVGIDLQFTDAAGAAVSSKCAGDFYLSSDTTGQAALTTKIGSLACGTDGLLLAFSAAATSAGIFRVVCETNGDVDVTLNGVAGTRWSGYVNVIRPNGQVRTMTTQAVW